MAPLVVKRTTLLVCTCLLVTVFAVATTDDAPIGLLGVIFMLLVSLSTRWGFILGSRGIGESLGRAVASPVAATVALLAVMGSLPADESGLMARFLALALAGALTAGVSVAAGFVAMLAGRRFNPSPTSGAP